MIFSWLIFTLLESFFIGLAILFQNNKKNYLLNNYKEFDGYEVTLDDFATSVYYKQSVYYKVKINDNVFIKNINSNPYFSKASMDNFTPAEYNGKKLLDYMIKNTINFIL